MRSGLVDAEFAILVAIAFDTSVRLPHAMLVNYAQVLNLISTQAQISTLLSTQLDLAKHRLGKSVIQFAWNHLNDV